MFTDRCIYFVLILTKNLRSDFGNHYDIFRPDCGGHYSTAYSYKEQANVSCLTFQMFSFLLYFSLNMGHKLMPDIHFGTQRKPSRAFLDTMGETISSQRPVPKVEVSSFCLMNCFP